MSLGGLAKVYKDIQQIRIGLKNKTWASENSNGRAIPKVYEDMIVQLKEMEKALVKEARQQLKDHPAWPWLSQVRGMGLTLAAQLLGYIGDIERFSTVSKLWRYCGLGVTDGRADRMRKGEKAAYNPQIKSLCYNIGTSFLKTNSPYRKLYDQAKQYYTETRPDWTKSRIHFAAMRKMEKVFLAHLWQKWREAEGLPTRQEYVFEYLGHSTRYNPEEFVA